MNANIPVPQAKYRLLIPNSRRWLTFRTVLTALMYLFGIIGVVGASLLIIYLFLSSRGHEQLLYPRHNRIDHSKLQTKANMILRRKNGVQTHWIARAKLYNSYKVRRNDSTTLDAKRIAYKPGTALMTVEDYKLICYYSLPDDESTRSLLPQAIDPNLCTHINVAFAHVSNSTIRVYDYQLKYVEEIMKLRDANRNLKILLSVGGSGDKGGFSEMVKTHENRKEFIKSIDYYVREHGFDGIDLDWEFPNLHSPDDRERMHFTMLLREIRSEINRQHRYTYLLSVAVAAPVFLVDICYDVNLIGAYVDYVNLMSYDYHFYTEFTPITGINSPLYATAQDAGYFATLNINYTVHYWLSMGMDKDKLMVGMPTYGHSFTLINPLNNGVAAPANGYGSLGSNGFVDYGDVCWFLSKNQIQPHFNTDAKSPYATKSREWVSFDDVTSLTYKAEYVKGMKLGGAMIWSLNSDDHRSICKQDQFPLVSRIRSILKDRDL